MAESNILGIITHTVYPFIHINVKVCEVHKCYLAARLTFDVIDDVGYFVFYMQNVGNYTYERHFNNFEIGFFQPNLVKFGAKRTFDPHLTPLDPIWGSNGGPKIKYMIK